jgi:hypothetical protein
MSRLYLESRHKSNISRCLNHSVLPGFLLLNHLSRRVLNDAVTLPHQSPVVYLIIDGTYNKKKGKKMENRIIYQKGYSSTHFFLLGIPYFPDRGIRIPLPRRLYRTKGYCQQHGYQYRSQVKLCEQMIRYAKLPAHLEVIVLFDSFFPSESVIQEIHRKGYHVVCSLPCSRVDAETRENLHQIGQQHLHPGRLTHRVTIRVSTKRGGYTHKSADKYEVKHDLTSKEKRTLSKFGQAQIVFSRQEHDQADDLRYFATDMLHLSTQQILHHYSYRGQIELFIKEMKSYLGFGDYQSLSFRATVRYVDIVVMAFLYLEHRKIQLMKQQPDSKAYRYYRTLQMTYVLAQEVNLTNFRYLQRKATSQSGQIQIEEALNRIPLVS